MTQRKTLQTRAGASPFNFGAIFGKKLVKRDAKGRKMTQKGAIHAKNPAKQPDHYLATNHERHQLRKIARSGK